MSPVPHNDTRDRSRIASLLLLFPLVMVALAAGAGLVINGVAASALDRADRIDVQLLNLREHIHEVALSGASYLIANASDERRALVAAAGQVDADLAAVGSSPGLSGEEAAVLGAAHRAWDATRPTRLTVLAVTADASTGVAQRVTLEDQLNSGVADVTAQLTALDLLNAADVSSRQQQRDASQTISALAIALAILIGFGGAVWLLRLLRDRQRAVLDRERRLSALVENASDGILVIDEAGEVLFVTPAFRDEFVDESAGPANFARMVHPDDRVHTAKAWQRVRAGGGGTVSEVEARVMRRNGEWRHVWVKLTNRVHDPAVRGIVLNVNDVSERREFERRLTHQALHDALTTLPNRDLLRHRMERADAAGGTDPHSVLYLDLDDFKRINDTLGHLAGDVFLTSVGARLCECVRPEDTVARLGGDEFAILLENTGADDAVLAAQRILRALAEPMVIEGKELHPSASIGIASGRLGALHSETLLGDADLAMYFAKRAGGCGYRVFAAAMRTDMLDRLELGEDLRSAIETGSLSVAYQPIVALRGEVIIGAEALARWSHPTRGWVGPDTFIPLAEELGLVDRIDTWVLREACMQGRGWIDRGHPDFKVAVNLSGKDLDRPDLVDEVARILAESGFPAGQLEIELTEGVAINESSGAHDALEALKNLGLHLAIDDFGTGYSALSRLRNLPFDLLKVDKAFVDDIGRTQQGTMLVDTILDMAHVLGLEVVAEGVETAVQADYLRERACDFAQGYLFSRPVGAAELGALLLAQLPAALPLAG